MWANRRKNPSQLGAIAAAGMLLCILTLLVCTLLSRTNGPLAAAFSIGHGRWVLRLGIALGVLLPGVVLSLRAVSVLKEGIRQEWWSEDEVEVLRKQVDRPVWSALIWLLLSVMAVQLVLLPQHSALASASMFFPLAISLLTSLQTAVRKPIPLERKTIDWSTAKPLQSEHWGSSRSGG